MENTEKITNNDKEIYEFNSYSSNNPFESIFGLTLSDSFSQEEINSVVNNPISNHDLARKLSRYCYNKSGVVSNGIDYMVALPCLDRVITSKKAKLFTKQKIKNNKELMISTLKKIEDKSFIRDALFKEMLDGIFFYYFETTTRPLDKTKFMNDYDVENICEINELGVNASIISLPYEYTKIVGKKNGRFVIAFNLRYFKDFTGEDLEKKLKKYPKEIREGYNAWDNGKVGSNSWLVLDNNKTMCRKIKCESTEAWGRPLAICALNDILYQDSFVETKRNVLSEINNKIIFQTLPEGKDKGQCSLTKIQQENQHSTVRDAVMKKNNRGGTSFFTISAGTKIDSLNVSTDIFDDKNESELNEQIALDMGIAASLLNGSGNGNYSSQQNNLELINAQLFSWIQDIQIELNHVINANIIKDEKNRVEVYYLPTSLVNRKSLFEMMKSLYTEAGGSLSFLIASAGITPEVYMEVLDDEIDSGIFERYQPHQTSYTLSKNDNNGRPVVDDPTNKNTIQSKGTGSNTKPKPSTK